MHACTLTEAAKIVADEPTEILSKEVKKSASSSPLPEHRGGVNDDRASEP